MTWTKSKQLSRAKAEETLRAVKEQFKEYLQGVPESEQPKLYEPGFHADCWTIAWEGCHDWSLMAFVGGFDEEIAGLAYDFARCDLGLSEAEARAKAQEAGRKPAHPLPPGVFVEPLNHWALCLYPEG